MQYFRQSKRERQDDNQQSKRGRQDDNQQSKRVHDYTESPKNANGDIAMSESSDDNNLINDELIKYLCDHAKNIKDNAEEDENLPYDDNCHFYEKALNFYYPEKYEKVFLLLNEAEEYPLINLCIKYELLRLIIYLIEKQGNNPTTPVSPSGIMEF